MLLGTVFLKKKPTNQQPTTATTKPDWVANMGKVQISGFSWNISQFGSLGSWIPTCQQRAGGAQRPPLLDGLSSAVPTTPYCHHWRLVWVAIYHCPRNAIFSSRIQVKSISSIQVSIKSGKIKPDGVGCVLLIPSLLYVLMLYVFLLQRPEFSSPILTSALLST